MTSATFLNLATATLATLNWVGLASVQFQATADSGLDTLNVEASGVPVPEPGALLLLGTGVATLIARRCRRRQA